MSAVHSAALSMTLLILSCAAAGQEWHTEALPFCSQLKAKGAKVSSRPFFVYEATDADTQCCDGLNLKLKGRTEQFGYFTIRNLPEGRYLVAFDLKTKRVVIPLRFDRAFNLKDCQPSSRVTVDRTTNRLSWEEWVNVD